MQLYWFRVPGLHVNEGIGVAPEGRWHEVADILGGVRLLLCRRVLFRFHCRLVPTLLADEGKCIHMLHYNIKKKYSGPFWRCYVFVVGIKNSTFCFGVQKSILNGVSLILIWIIYRGHLKKIITAHTPCFFNETAVKINVIFCFFFFELWNATDKERIYSYPTFSLWKQ